MNQRTKTSPEVTKCVFCSEPVRYGCSWWEDKPMTSLNRHVLNPVMEEVLTQDGIVMAYTMHTCKDRAEEP